MAPTRNTRSAHHNKFHRLPERISFAQGAGLFVHSVTEWRALFGRANTRPGDTVLTTRQRRRWRGCDTVCRRVGRDRDRHGGSDEGVAVVKDKALTMRSITTARDTSSRSPRQWRPRPRVILEMLANVNLDHDLTVIAPGGRVVVIGNRGRVEIDAPRL